MENYKTPDTLHGYTLNACSEKNIIALFHNGFEVKRVSLSHWLEYPNNENKETLNRCEGFEETLFHALGYSAAPMLNNALKQIHAK